MRALVTSIIFSCVCSIVHSQLDSLYIKKWYYCDSMTKPSKLDRMLFYSDKTETDCGISKTVFYWELKEDGSFEWSDTTQNSQNNIIDGIIVVSHKKWHVEGDKLHLGDDVFIIDVINSTRMLIHRKVD